MIDTSSFTDPPAPWGRYDLSNGVPRAVRIGPRDLWLRMSDGEIWLAMADVPFGTDPDEPTPGDPSRSPPPELPWSRWATAGGEGEVVLRPVFPDRSLVLEPERPFWLLPRARARIYVRVPLWIRVELPQRGTPGLSAILDVLPVLPLSDTWWGSFLVGDLAYWLPTTARREMRPDLFQSHLAVCPLDMTNRSAADLRVEKLALQVSHLSIFAIEDRLWADESSVTYLGEGEGSHVERKGVAPDEATGAVLVSPPRSPAHRSMRARTFGRLVELSGLGGGA